MILSQEICSRYTDAELVKLSATDMDYFSCIFLRYEAPLLRYIQRITSAGEEAAEDILQDAFVKAWKNINSYRPDMRLSSWLYRIAHNEAISSWRKSSARGGGKTELLSEANTSRLKEDLESASETDQELYEALYSLEDKYREVMALRYLEEKSYEEISDILRIPEGTVAIRISRAKTILKQNMVKP